MASCLLQTSFESDDEVGFLKGYAGWLESVGMLPFLILWL